jgi:DNA-binding NtrC family response regulator
MVLRQLEKVACTDAEVLLTGPSGVGKEVYATHLHTRSKRSEAPFVAVNCGAIPSHLFESEVFGHASGAYTGAHGSTLGLMGAAEGGTVFLDEVDALPRCDQVKVLRLLQEHEYRRLGDSRVRKANVRFVSGSNADLARCVHDGTFREDLFFRLRVVPISIPPLSERLDDVDPLLDHFVTRYAVEYGIAPVVLSPAARGALRVYAWPGNVRELENCVRYLTCLRLERAALPDDLPLLAVRNDLADLSELDGPFSEVKADVVSTFERVYLDRALRKAGGNISHAATASGKDRRAFFELLRKHAIRAERYRAS